MHVVTYIFWGILSCISDHYSFANYCKILLLLIFLQIFLPENLAKRIVQFLLDPFYRMGQVYKRKFCPSSHHTNTDTKTTTQRQSHCHYWSPALPEDSAVVGVGKIEVLRRCCCCEADHLVVYFFII